MPTYCAAVCPELSNPNHNPDLGLFKLTLGTPVTPDLGNVHTNFGFATPFCF